MTSPAPSIAINNSSKGSGGNSGTAHSSSDNEDCDRPGLFSSREGCHDNNCDIPSAAASYNHDEDCGPVGGEDPDCDNVRTFSHVDDCDPSCNNGPVSVSSFKHDDDCGPVGGQTPDCDNDRIFWNDDCNPGCNVPAMSAASFKHDDDCNPDPGFNNGPHATAKRADLV
jgi:hypothetical protein